MNIVLFSTADWDNPFWTNKQHMAKVFEKHNHKVIYVDSLGIRKPSVAKKDIFRILRRFKSLFKPYKKVSDNIWVVSPFVIPFHSISFIKKFNNIFLSFIIKLLMFFLNFKDIIVWTYSPVTDEIVDRFDARYVIYHCVDDLSALPNVDKDMVKFREKNLILKSDYIFTTSQNLFEYIKELNPNTYYQNNVCDFEHFSIAREKIYEKPNDIKEIQGNIIMFVGAISSYKIDFSLLAMIATKHPAYNLVMIGQIGEGQPETRIDELTNLKNIHLLGPKEYKDIPSYLQYADVAIIPSNINDYTKSMFPMKFFEYLSSGVDVVTTDLHALYQYKDICFISKTHNEFEKHIVDILDNNIHKEQEKILKVCKMQTWDNRYKVMMDVIK